MMSTPLTARIAEEYASIARAPPAADAAPTRRRAAFEELVARGLPSSRDDNWKYANLRALERQRFVAVAPAAAPGAADAPLASATLPAMLPAYSRYVFVDGAFAPGLSASVAATPARLTPLAASSGSAPVPASADERFALLNTAFGTDGLLIQVPAGSDRPVLLELLFVASAGCEAGASYPRVALHLDPGAHLGLVERHLSAGFGASFVNSFVSVDVGRGASLQHYRLQDLSARSILFDTLSATLAADAAYRLHGISTGAQSARSTMSVRLGGERADLTLAVAALGDRQQVQDAYAVVEHAAPRARTDQTFRGIAAGRARVAFNGKIVVAPGAVGTDSRQSLRGLLAGPEAEIDVRPQLEIYTDDVRCSHGATAGKLDEDMLFYLLSRGLERAVAQRLLKWAFLEDVIAKIEVPGLRRQIEGRVADHLQDGALQELL
jgi:Fe-S cluster assembly protein SufD